MDTALVATKKLQIQYDELIQRHQFELSQHDAKVLAKKQELDLLEENFKKECAQISQRIEKNSKNHDEQVSAIELSISREKSSIEAEYEKKLRELRENYDKQIRAIRHTTDEKIEVIRKKAAEVETTLIDGEQSILDEISHYKGNIASLRKTVVLIEKERYKIQLFPAKESQQLFIAQSNENLQDSLDELFRDVYKLRETKNKLAEFRLTHKSDDSSSIYNQIEELEKLCATSLKKEKEKYEEEKAKLSSEKELALSRLEETHEGRMRQEEGKYTSQNDKNSSVLSELKAKQKKDRAKLLLEIESLNEERDTILDSQRRQLNEFGLSAHKLLDLYFQEPDYMVCKKEFIEAENVPDKICIGYIPEEISSTSLLKWLYSRDKLNSYTPINLDIREGGNIIIKPAQPAVSDEKLYKTLCAVSMRFLEKFPLGSISLTLIDTLSDRSMATIARSFQQSQSEKGKLVVKYGLIDTVDKAVAALDEISLSVNRVFNKLSSDCPDLHSLYKSDNTEAFNLVVIRNGFKDLVNRQETLNLLVSLAKKSECGVRLMIVDDTDSTQSFDEQRTILINQIISRSTQIDYKDSKYIIKGKLAEICTIEGDKWVSKIEHTTTTLRGLLDTNSNKFVTYEQIGFGEVFAKADEAIEIPIGLSAGKPYSIVFGCGGAKANIGCMVLGRVRYGKSSVFHSVVINGAMKYSPEDLKFWLLDFKSGAASSSYINANIPHISLVAANNSTEDAFSLLKLLSNELEQRQREFNSFGVSKKGVSFSDIAEYNRYIEQHPNCGKKRMPRIVVVIDEAQDLIPPMGLDDADYTNNIKVLLTDIANKCGNRGVHIVMCAQNFQNGKSYELIDSFMGQAKTRISFNIEPGYADSLGKSFKEGQGEIATLPKLTAMASSEGGVDSLTKFVVGVSDGKDNFEPYFNRIRTQYKAFLDKEHTAIIGDISQLKLQAKVHALEDTTYLDVIKSTSEGNNNNNFDVVFGEDYYSLAPMSFRYNDENISGCVIVGNNSKIGMSILLSILYSSLESGYECYAYDGMARNNLFKRAIQLNQRVIKHNSLFELLINACREMKRRKNLLRTNPETQFVPLMVVLNNICSSVSNELSLAFGEFETNYASSDSRELKEDGEGVYIPSQTEPQGEDDVDSEMNALTLLTQIINQGSEVGIFVNLSIAKAEYQYQELFNSSNMVACYAVNPIEGLNSGDMYRVKIHLESISKLTYPVGHAKATQVLEPQDHPFAVFIRNSQAFRVRPVIWNDNDLELFRETI